MPQTTKKTNINDKSLEPVKKILPLIPLRNVVLFPSVETSLFFGRKESMKSLLYAYDNTNKLVLITSQRNPKTEKPEIKDLYSVGVIAKIEHILQTDGSLHAIVKGLSRVNIVSLTQQEPHLMAEFVDLPTITESTTDIQQSAETLLSQLKKAFALGRQFDLPAMMHLSTGISSTDLADQVCFSVDAKIPEKQQLLETLLVTQRLKAATEFLIKEMKVAELERSIEEKTQEKFNVGMKRNILEERKKQIEKELRKMGEDTGSELDNLEKKIKTSKMPKDIKKRMLREYSRLIEMGNMAPEASYIRTYLETVIELPWGKYSPDSVSLAKAKKILDQDHYGLIEVKERILEYLAVLNLKNKNKSKQSGTNILCFIGPPGVGKTSLGRSIAKAMDREFVRASLGGIRDEAEIRGHRRTYVGAMPGRIIKGLKDAKSMNPVYMLDEIDKIGADYRGDPTSALLETLDPEQNKDFVDHYLDFPVDLSRVFFILTGNDISRIPGPLRDRVEIINFSGYTQEEKKNIVKKYLIKKQLEANGLDAKNVTSLSDLTINFMISRYTREAGVRNLERVVANIFRKVAKKIVTKKVKKVDIDNLKTIKKYLGPEKFSSQIKGKKDEIGLSTGLAWTSVGGEILFIEVNIMPGKGQLILTGKLGSVMKESCQAAVSFIRSRSHEFSIDQNFHKIDIHIHFPEGATPKDGPSAGGAITTSLISALKNMAVPRDIGMTGEITIRGNILEIGGLKEKAIAAHQAGIKTVFIPKDNRKSLVDVPTEVKKSIKFIPIEHYDQIYKHIFLKNKKSETTRSSVTAASAIA
ncbi:endopeptidase La [Candidatus Shapirobacteria bacterium RIFOXYD1_FULL_38_32]|uniref:Lon protease n=3 Tax=Patescibacteria group TaxID=1783273 RepID=A0A1F7SUR4_9BACT|nr:MAG: endopeptidase La [Candidatus Nomurabacteria bacterium RIFOXYA1_FULL_35_17]OGL56937.1 MAG: endopeptidase La [Candidatus Shapirobacteria bacterium RIFOXYC1_FULL_38_24]OGL57275.1 MAG: endopeptidase La [Candidatus Shapirobacteria bacterium RIFOXYD1_FULL_38_32]OGL57529.1 MAG: endopeptidase La [Candidatus Shapirobacteria bacterium RIFOXYB1_FULL_38_38]HCU55250.1 endopeptidase La [Candidatus Shapirobacteria bacterium]